MGSIFDLTQGFGTIGLGTAQGLQRSLGGHPDLVTLLDPDTGSAILQCDAVLSETHARESPATVFPLEDGACISDHVLVAPFELTIQGVITDTPVGDKASLVTEGIATALSALMPPLAVFEAGAAYRLQKVHQGSASRSATAFEALLRIQAGDPTARPPVPPKPFDVVTKLRRYPSMMMRSLSVPRDAGTSNAIVFQAALTQMLVVQPQTVAVQVLPLGASQRRLGETSKKPIDTSAYQQGKATGVAQADAIGESGKKLASFANKVAGGIF